MRPEAGHHRRREQELPLVAEIPDVRAEDDDQAERDRGQRRGTHQAVLPGRELDAPAIDVEVEPERVVPECRDQDPAGNERQQEREHGADDEIGEPREGRRRPHALGGVLDGRGHVAHAALLPTISSPMRSAAPGPFSNVPTSRPW